MRTRIWISEITFSDDTTLQFEKDDIVVFVGPNNAGKSASLKEAASLVKAKNKKGKVLKDLSIEKEGDEIEWRIQDRNATESGFSFLFFGFGKVLNWG